MRARGGLGGVQESISVGRRTIRMNSSNKGTGGRPLKERTVQ